MRVEHPGVLGVLPGFCDVREHGTDPVEATAGYVALRGAPYFRCRDHDIYTCEGCCRYASAIAGEVLFVEQHPGFWLCHRCRAERLSERTTTGPTWR